MWNQYRAVLWSEYAYDDHDRRSHHNRTKQRAREEKVSWAWEEIKEEKTSWTWDVELYVRCALVR